MRYRALNFSRLLSPLLCLGLLSYVAAGQRHDPRERDERSVVHQVSLGARYAHASGFFASWESAWTGQNLHDDASWMDGDSVWRHDLWAGWRFLRRKAEVAVGLLNLTDEDYRVYPLNEFAPSYRDRIVAVTGRFAF